MTGDEVVERGATWLEGLSRKTAAQGGPAARLARPLAADAVFLRKLKPSLVAARLRGQADAASAANPSTRRSKGSVNKLVVVAAAFTAGMFLARLIDWKVRSHRRH